MNNANRLDTESLKTDEDALTPESNNYIQPDVVTDFKMQSSINNLDIASSYGTDNNFEFNP